MNKQNLLQNTTLFPAINIYTKYLFITKNLISLCSIYNKTYNTRFRTSTFNFICCEYEENQFIQIVVCCNSLSLSSILAYSQIHACYAFTFRSFIQRKV